MIGYILAGGAGRRMGAIPKYLLPVMEKPFIEWHSTFMKKVCERWYIGIDKQWIKFIHYPNHVIEVNTSDRYTKYGPTLKELLFTTTPKTSIIWVMGDHYIDYHSSFFESLSWSFSEDFVIFIDSKPPIAGPSAHSMFLFDEEGNVSAYGKNLEKWSALDTGLFYAGPKLINFIKKLDGDFDTRDILNVAIKESLIIRYIDFAGKVLWFGANTPEEYVRGLSKLLFNISNYPSRHG